MSFFGQNNNNNNQSSGFGGFGSNNQSSGGFGQSSTPSTGFGSTQNNTNNAASGGFGGFGSGAGGSGFGSNTGGSLFGQNKPAFGAASNTGGGLFGGGTSTTGGSSGFGGFGSNTANTANTTTAPTGGSLFGSASKPAFGGASTSGGLFGGGGGGNTSGGFGSTNAQPANAFGGSGFGQNNANAQCEGTGSTPFQAYTEKEGTTSMTNHFQSISFMAPYKNFSFEELRLADYNQGRRYGNASGQAGAFGSTNFGSFGQQNTSSGFGQANNTSGGIFGSNNATSSPFGGNNQANSNASGGLFGQKPGSLFGATSSAAAPSGGLFGTAGNTASTGFGSTNTGGFGSGTTGGGGLFGSNNTNNNTAQSKPFSFGSTTATAGGGFGSGGSTFGNANNSTTGGGLFGSSNQTNAQPSNPFGQSNNSTANTGSTSTGFGGFGQNNQNQTQGQNNTSNPFGGFGQQGQQSQDNKPGGLFGNTASSTNTGGGLFGNQQNNNQSSGGLFGQSNTQQSGGTSLFGQKPAAGGGLFGQANTNTNTNTNTNSGTSLFGGFGNNNQSQNQGSSLFGNNNNQQKPGGLFGNTTTNTGGGGLFGGNTGANNNQQPVGGLFNLGGSNNNQQANNAGGGLFGNNTNNNNGSSLFGNSQNNQQQAAPQNQFQPAQTLQTSINDPNAFGSPSIFTGLPPPPQVSGPVATPISQKSKQKKSAFLPYYKLTPSGASRFQTPQRQGYGFTYSTYGTPSSVTSNASTPGGLSSSFLGNSLMRGSVGRGLGKSLSTSNLRGSFGDSDSILTPGAFSAGNSRYGSASSMKKLTIDRNLRTDLFGDRDRSAPLALPSPEKERQGGILKKKVSFDAHALSNQPNGEQANGVSGAELELSASPAAEEPSFLRTPSRINRAKPNGLPVTPEMEQIRGNELAIVPEDGSPEQDEASSSQPGVTQSQADKRPGQYWMNPSKEQIQKMTKEQRRRLSGFSVGRDGCGKVTFDEPVDLTNINLNDLFDNIVVITTRNLTVYPDATKKPAQGRGMNVPSTIYLDNSWPRARDRRTPVPEKSGPRFNKHVERLRKVNGTIFVDYLKDNGTWIFKVPHFTTYGLNYDDDASEAESLHLNDSVLSQAPDTPTPKSRASSRSSTPKEVSKPAGVEVDDAVVSRRKKYLPGSFDNDGITDDEEDEIMEEEHPEKPFLGERLAASPSDSGEDEPSEPAEVNDDSKEMAIIVREENGAMDIDIIGAFPDAEDDLSKLDGDDSLANMSNDWLVELQRSIRPRQSDRRTLRQLPLNRKSGENEDYAEEEMQETTAAKPAIATSIDLMNSLFGKPQPKKSARKTAVSKSSSTRSLPNDSTNDHISEPDRAWNALTTKAARQCPLKVTQESVLVPPSLTYQRSKTTFSVNDHVPMANVQATPFRDYASKVKPASSYEWRIWSLASVLFDDLDYEAHGLPAAEQGKYDARVRKDQLVSFWAHICEEEQEEEDNGIAEAASPEEQAIALLSLHKTPQACETLMQARNFRLASLVAQIGGDQTIHAEISAQINSWRDLNVLSEMSEPIRALYSLLAGDTCICEGKQGQHVEDRARTFPISERFGLDWKRAFALRLYYAIKMDDPVESAVAMFAEDIENGNEPRNPADDILFSLLRLYAASRKWLPMPSLAQVLLSAQPSNTPLGIRLVFQLYQVLKLRFPSAASETDAADYLTLAFASQLDAPRDWQWSFFTLLHITDATRRQASIQALLAHHAASIKSDPPHDPNWTLLVDQAHVPPAWIYTAKALYSRSVEHNRVRESSFLVRAGQWSAAHDVLRRHVGPDCVIAEEWAQLRGLLSSFAPAARKNKIDDWQSGGGLYEDYLDLLDAGDEMDTSTKNKDKDTKKRNLVKRLTNALAQLQHTLDQDSKDNDDAKAHFRELVAVKEMSRVVQRERSASSASGARDDKGTGDEHLKRTVDMSRAYYRTLLRT